VASRVLVVQHEADTPAAWLGDDLEELGVELVVLRPYDGEPLPVALGGHQGVIVLGGSMDSWDDAGTPWLPATRRLVRTAEQASVPTLGICLGHQVAAAALGGRVGRNPTGETLAVLPILWSDPAAADPLFGDLMGVGAAVHWNRDVMLAAPPGARVLARSPDGAVQAARLGCSVWGVQYHPEAGADLVGRWLTGAGASAPAAPCAPSGSSGYLDAVLRHEPGLRAGCRALAHSFAGLLGRVAG